MSLVGQDSESHRRAAEDAEAVPVLVEFTLDPSLPGASLMKFIEDQQRPAGQAIRPPGSRVCPHGCPSSGRGPDRMRREDDGPVWFYRPAWPGEKDHFFVKVHADRGFEVAAQIHDPDYTQEQKKTQLNLPVGKKSQEESGDVQKAEEVIFRFRQSVARPDSRYVAWYLPDVNGRNPISCSTAMISVLWSSRSRTGP